ncbi:MAG: NADH-quinone oxidoreductase subunit I [Elusimicrobiota bacterium]
MIGYFSKVYKVAAALAAGHLITLKYMLKPSITVHYPTEKLVPYERFRGTLLFDAGTCISCNLCVKACPSSCIALENATNEAGKKVAKVAWYSIDFGKCNFCRLCEESCPTKPKSVWHCLDYEVVFASRDEMVRCWKKDFPFIGKYFDRRTQEFKDPEGQVRIHEVPPRRS